MSSKRIHIRLNQFAKTCLQALTQQSNDASSPPVSKEPACLTHLGLIRTCSL